MKKGVTFIIKIITIQFLLLYFIILPIYIESRLYYPDTKTPVPPIKLENICYKTPDNVKINAWYVKAKENQPTIVFCHGNGGNLSYYQSILKFLSANGYGVFLFDYRGYGKSTGIPSEIGLYTDLKSAIHYLEDKKRIFKEQIVLWGQSLGGAVAIDIAAKNKFKGVIIQSSFTNVKDMATYTLQTKYLNIKTPFKKNITSNFIKYMPLAQNYDSIEKIKNVQSPLFIAHALPDKIIPCHMSVKLSKANHKAILYISKTGGHNHYDWIENKALNFIQSLK